MATTPVSQSLNRGGAFLISSSAPGDVFTPADLTDDQRLVGQTAEEFVANEVVPQIPELEQHKEGLMPLLLKKAGELGLLGGGIPEEYGGSGLDKISATVLAEKLAGYASFAVSHGAHSGIGTVPIVYFGTEEQKKKYLPKIATGELLSCYCLSEPQAGSDALASRTRAVLSPDGKNWILTGQKMWITNGGFADVYVVFAKVDGEKFSCFIVERGTPGFSVGAEEKKMGIRGSSTVPLFFENAPVPKENLLHEIGRGHIVAFNTLNVGRFSLGAYCLGGSKNVLECCVEIFKGANRVRQADLRVRPDPGEAGRDGHSHLCRRVDDLPLGRNDRGRRGGIPTAADDKTQQAMKVLEEYAIESSISKVAGSETLDYCVDESVQIFGGYGFHEDYPVARAYRDSRINRIFEGTNEINRMLIIQMLMKRAMTGVLPLIPAAMKLSEEVLAGPFVRGSSCRRFRGRRTFARASQEDFSAGGGHGGAEIPRQTGRGAGSCGCAFGHRDGCLRDGIVFAPRAESFGSEQANGKRDERYRARFYPRSYGPHREVRAHGAFGRCGRRHSYHATCCAAQICQARSAEHCRAPPARGCGGPGTGSIPFRRSLAL